MPSTSVSFNDDQLNLPNQYVHVTHWAVRDEPLYVLFTALVFLMVAVIVGYVSHSLPLGLVCLLALYGSMWPSWLPISHEFDLVGILRTVGPFQTRITWDSIGDWHTTGNCLVLHRRRNPGPLEYLVARYIPVQDHHQLQDIVNTIAFHVAPSSLRAGSTVTTAMATRGEDCGEDRSAEMEEKGAPQT